MPVIPGILASSKSGHISTNNFYQISQLSPSAVSTVTFSSIPSTYKSLQVRFNLVPSATGALMRMQFNGDTASNYATHELYGTGGSTGAGGVASNISVNINQNVGTVNTTYPFVGIIDVIDYANTNKYKTAKALSGQNQNLTSGSVQIDSGVWLNTSAVTSLTLLHTTGTFTGTITLYGAN